MIWILAKQLNHALNNRSNEEASIMIEDIEKALEDEYGYEGEPDTTDTAHGLHSNLRVEKRDKDTDVLEDVQEVKNIITEDGADLVRDAIGNTPHTSAFRWTAIGDDASASFNSASSSLGSEVARSQNAFNTTSNFGQFSNVTTFTNVAATVRESALFNRDTSGTMLAAQTFGDITLTTDDKLEVIWKVYFSEV